jgi:hypothetical protein
MSDHTPQLPLLAIAPDGTYQELPSIVPITNRRTKDLAGQRFGRLLVLGFIGRNKHGQAMWLCKCDCGEHFATLGASLLRGRTQSCSCLSRDIIIQRNFRHGLSHTPEHIAWTHIIARCENPNEIGYKDYGGRGIAMCERWRQSFKNFLEDMGPKPGPEYSVERIDNEKGYSPKNCKWATPTEQSNNKRNNNFLEYNGERLTMAEWARKIGMAYGTFQMRVKLGWPMEKILTVPIKQYRHD